MGQLIPGTYAVKTEATGFQSELVNDVKVNVGSISTVNVTMQVGQVTQQVEVTAAAPVLDTATATVGTVVGITGQSLPAFSVSQAGALR